MDNVIADSSRRTRRNQERKSNRISRSVPGDKGFLRWWGSEVKPMPISGQADLVDALTPATHRVAQALSDAGLSMRTAVRHAGGGRERVTARMEKKAADALISPFDGSRRPRGSIASPMRRAPALSGRGRRHPPRMAKRTRRIDRVYPRLTARSTGCSDPAKRPKRARSCANRAPTCRRAATRSYEICAHHKALRAGGAGVEGRENRAQARSHYTGKQCPSGKYFDLAIQQANRLT